MKFFCAGETLASEMYFLAIGLKNVNITKIEDECIHELQAIIFIKKSFRWSFPFINKAYISGARAEKFQEFHWISLPFC